MSQVRKVALPRELAVPIVGDAALAGPIADGRLIPVLLLDTSSRPEVSELIRVHEHLPPGDVTSQWGRARDDEDRIMLILAFDRPIALSVVLLLSIEHQGILVETMLRAGSVYLQAGQPGDRFRDHMDEPRILLELPETGFRPYWDKLFLKRMTNVMARRLSLSKRKARPAAEELIAEVKKLSEFRLANRPRPRS